MRLLYNIDQNVNKISITINSKINPIPLNSYILNMDNLDYYSNFGVIPSHNPYDHITINLIDLFKEGI